MARSNAAARRYVRRFMPAMAAYVAVILAVDAWVRRAPPRGALLYGAAVLPAVPLVVVIWALGRYLIEEEDEYQRSILVRSMLWGAGVTLALATVWGFLETYAEAPHLPGWYAFPLFSTAFGVAQGLRQLADRLGARR